MCSVRKRVNLNPCGGNLRRATANLDRISLFPPEVESAPKPQQSDPATMEARR
jgi:hypothetical protein